MSGPRILGGPSPSLTAPASATLSNFTPVVPSVRAQTIAQPSPQSTLGAQKPISRHPGLTVGTQAQQTVLKPALASQIAQERSAGPNTDSNPTPCNPVGIEVRLDELKHFGGCRTRIQWSPTGTLAALSPDSKSVGLYHYWADPADRRWKLSGRIPLTIPTHSHSLSASKTSATPPALTPKFCHVHWNEIGHVLAVVDTSGALRLFSTPSSSRGHMIMSKIHTLQKAPPPVDPKHRPMFNHTPELDTDPVVLLHWLPVIPVHAKTTVLWSGTHAGPETDDSGEWKYDFFTQYAIGPASPFEGMGSLVCLHRSGRVRLIYQASAHDWMETPTFLGSPDPGLSILGNLPILHAAVVPRNPPHKDSHLLLATFDGRTLRIYCLRTKWPSKLVSDTQTIQDEDLASLDAKCILSMPFPPKPIGDVKLTHLEFLSSPPRSPNDEDAKSEDVHPVLVASFHGFLPSRGNTTITASWDVLLSGPEGSSLPSRCTLQPQGAHRSPSTVIHISRSRFDTVLTICYADGSIEFRDRQLRTLEPQRRPETIRMLADVGFAFPKPTARDLTAHIALSPNGCVAAGLLPNGRVILRRMEYVFGNLRNQCTESNGIPHEQCAIPTAVAAALALTHSRASAQGRSHEDIFTIMTPSHGSLRREFARQALLTMMLSLDCNVTESPDQLRAMLRVPALFKILGAHHTLQLGPDGSRSAETKVSWMILNLKMILSGLGTLAQSPGPMRPGLSGMIRYTLDLISYSILDVAELGKEVEVEYRNQKRAPANAHQATPDDNNRAGMEQLKLIQKCFLQHRSPGLLIFMCSVSRAMLLSALKLIRTAYALLFNWGRDVRQPTTQSTNQQVWRVISELFSHFPINLQSSALLDLLNSVEKGVQACYEAQQGVDRGAVEREMLLAGTISPVLLPAVRQLLVVDLPKFMAGPVVDQARLQTCDLSWLGFSDDIQTRENREGATLAALPINICRAVDHSDTCRPSVVRLRQMYPVAVGSSEAYRKWQSVGGQIPTVPHFPLWAMTTLQKPSPSCWVECAPIQNGDSASFPRSFNPLPNLPTLPHRPGLATAPASAPITGHQNPPLISPSMTVPLTASPSMGSSLKRKRSMAFPHRSDIPSGATGTKTDPLGLNSNHDEGADSEDETLTKRCTATTNRSALSVPFLSRPPRFPPVDILLKRKVELPAPMRRCVRCGSLSEDLFWVMSSSAREAVARDAASVVANAKSKIAAATQKTQPVPPGGLKPGRSGGGGGGAAVSAGINRATTVAAGSSSALPSAASRPGSSSSSSSPSRLLALSVLNGATAPNGNAPPHSSNPSNLDTGIDPNIFFVPPRPVPKNLMFEQAWMVHASRHCVCTGEWAKII